jgi:Rhs element Vgr protein
MGAFTVTVLSEGNVIDPSYELVSVQVNKEVNRIPYAELVFKDGDIDTGQFPISDSTVFVPGNAIEIKARYEDDPDSEQTLIKGLVVLQEVNVEQTSSTLRVALKDSAVAMTKANSHAVFNNMTDGEIIETILGFNNISFNSVADTKPKHIEMMQYGSSDWDFIVTRAESNGLFVAIQDGEVSVQAIESPSQPKMTVEYGIDGMYSFSIEANAERQYAKYTGISWDYQKQENVEVNTDGNPLSTQGNLNNDSLAAKMGPNNYTLATSAKLDQDELTAWATAKSKRSQLGLIRGYIAIPGRGDLRLLDTIEIKGMGQRFNGKTVITGIGQRVSAGSWLTDIQFGLSDQWLLHSHGVNGLPASGLLPAVSGLQIGTVAKIYEKPSNDKKADYFKQLKIQISLPTLKQDHPYLVWARLACPDAGMERGYYFRPEIDDEVVVGFVNDDPRQAVILGSLYSSQKHAPHKRFGKVDEKNNARGIASKLDDNGKTIKLNDQHGNSITMDENGITLKSTKDITLEAEGNVEIKGNKVDIQ